MSVPLFAFALVYLGLVVACAIIGAVNVALTLRFGLQRQTSVTMSLLFVMATIVVVGATWYVLRDVDWSSTWTLSLPSIGPPGPSL